MTVFKYGMAVTLAWERDGKKLRQSGVVIRTSPLVASIHSVHVAFKQDGTIITEGFGASARMEPKQQGDD
jgi:hypothetical protein